MAGNGAALKQCKQATVGGGVNEIAYARDDEVEAYTLEREAVRSKLERHSHSSAEEERGRESDRGMTSHSRDTASMAKSA